MKTIGERIKKGISDVVEATVNRPKALMQSSISCKTIAKRKCKTKNHS
ncbi:MAG: hypothetical protein L0Y68_04230 [Candidatus Dadabacteria bacterium]|nr:hypothetical protein [Candidatus Dadabacteria bacterium]